MVKEVSINVIYLSIAVCHVIEFIEFYKISSRLQKQHEVLEELCSTLSEVQSGEKALLVLRSVLDISDDALKVAHVYWHRSG